MAGSHLFYDPSESVQCKQLRTTTNEATSANAETDLDPTGRTIQESLDKIVGLARVVAQSDQVNLPMQHCVAPKEAGSDST
jgi:hypothetical protein